MQFPFDMVDCDVSYGTLDNHVSCFNEPKPASECIDAVEDDGFEYLGSGTNRIVFGVSNDCVVKFTKGGGGWVGNKREAEISARDDAPEFIVPVEDHDSEYNWILMPHVDTSARLSEMNELRERMRESEWYCKDINRGNVGIYDGEAVLFDYGEGCKKGSRLL